MIAALLLIITGITEPLAEPSSDVEATRPVNSQDLRWSCLLAEMNATKTYVVVYFDTCGRKWAHECVARNPSEAEDDCWDNVRHVASIAEVIER